MKYDTFILLLLISINIINVRASWLVQEIYEQSGCNISNIDIVMVQEIAVCYSDGMESNKYEEIEGELFNFECSDDDCKRCSKDETSEIVNNTCLYESIDASSYKQYISTDFPTTYQGKITVRFKYPDECAGELSSISITPFNNNTNNDNNTCTPSPSCDSGYMDYCQIPSFLLPPTNSTPSPSPSPTLSPTPPPLSPLWLIREFHVSSSCNNLLFSNVVDINSCFEFKISGTSLKYEKIDSGSVEMLNCYDSNCNNCSKVAEQLTIRECQLYNPNFYFNDTYTSVYTIQYISQYFPSNFPSSVTVAVEYKGDECEGEVNSVTLSPGLPCVPTCVWATQGFCGIPSFLYNYSDPTSSTTSSLSSTSTTTTTTSFSSSSVSSSSTTLSPVPHHGGKGLGVGAIFGIIICITVVIGMIVGGIYYKKFYSKRNATPSEEYSPIPL